MAMLALVTLSLLFNQCSGQFFFAFEVPDESRFPDQSKSMFDINSYRVVMPSQLPKPAVRVTLAPQSGEDVSSSFRPQSQPAVHQPQHQPPETPSRQTSSALSISSSPRITSTRGTHRQFFPERRLEPQPAFTTSDSGLDSSAQNHVFLRQPLPSQQQPSSGQPQLFSVPPDPRFRAALAAASQGSQPSGPQPIITDPRLLTSSSQGLLRQDVNGPNFSHQLVTLPRSPAPESPTPNVASRFAVPDQTFIPGPPPFTDTPAAPTTSQLPGHHQPQRFAAASSASSSFSHQPQPQPQSQTSLTPAQIAALNFFNGSPNPQAFSHLKERAEKQRQQEEEVSRLRAQQEAAARAQAEAEARAQAEANARARAQQEQAIRAAQEAALRAQREAESRAAAQRQSDQLRSQQESQARSQAEAALRAQRETQAAREAAIRAQQQADAAAQRWRALQEQLSRGQQQPQSFASNPGQQQPQPQQFAPQNQANANNLPIDPFNSNLDIMRTSDRRNRITSTSDQRQSFSSQPVAAQQFARPTARPTSAPIQAQPAQPVSSNSGNFRAANLQIQQLPADSDNDGIPGEAGRDYPTLVSIPETSFSCSQQPLAGYYADTETACQVVHFCQAGGTQDSFLCPNGTIFNQEKFSCQWWYEVNCANAPKFYILNDNLYRVPATNNNNNANNPSQPASSASVSSASSSSASAASSSSSSKK